MRRFLIYLSFLLFQFFLIGFGSNLYKPGRSAAEVGEIARELVAEWQRLAADQAGQQGGGA